jgi:hypothetical protein
MNATLSFLRLVLPVFLPAWRLMTSLSYLQEAVAVRCLLHVSCQVRRTKINLLCFATINWGYKLRLVTTKRSSDVLQV